VKRLKIRDSEIGKDLVIQPIPS